MLPQNTAQRVSFVTNSFQYLFRNIIINVDVGSDSWSMCCDDIIANTGAWTGPIYFTLFASSETNFEIEILSKCYPMLFYI